MRKAINTIKAELKYMNNDIDFIKGASIYGYLIFSSIAMLIGLYVGSRG